MIFAGPGPQDDGRIRNAFQHAAAFYEAWDECEQAAAARVTLTASEPAPARQSPALAVGD